MKKHLIVVGWVALAMVAGAGDIVRGDDFAMLNIVPMMPGEEEVAAADAAEYVRLTGNEVVLYSLTLQPQGRPATDKVDVAVKSYRRFAKLLEGTGARPGILLQAIIGHWTGDQVNRDVEPWQRSVNWKGEITRWCPLDPGYRAYIRETAARLAGERPCLILGDDDIRAFSPHAECFCPLHTAEYNRRTGGRFTPEELRKAIAAAPMDSAEHRAFVELQRDTVAGVCALLREGIDSVDPSIPAGVCQPGWVWSRAQVGDYAKAIAAKGQVPFLRLANGRYHEDSPRTDMANDSLRTQALMAMAGEGALLLDEADTYPHNTWSKSAVAFHAKLAAGAFFGLKGAKMWYVNGHKAGEPVNRHYTSILARHRGFYGALAAAARGTKAMGVAIPIHPEFPFDKVTARERSELYDSSGWAQTVFGKTGVPYFATRDFSLDAVYALAGRKSVQRFTDAQLKAMLSKKALVDGDAARELIARGFADLIGVEDTGRKGGYTAEMREDTHAKMSNPLSTEMPIFKAREGAEVLASLIWQPFSSSKTIERISPSATLFANVQGGRVLVTAYHMRMGYAYKGGEARQKWIYSLLDRVNGATFENIAANHQNTFAAARRAADGAELVFVCNTNYDPDDRILLRRAAVPKKVEMMANDGTWKAAEFTFRDGEVAIPADMPCYGVKVVRIGN